MTSQIDFGHQYEDCEEELDPNFPPALMGEIKTTVFVDSDHGHDKRTGRSITGFVGLFGSTPGSWGSKRQSSVQASTFGAEFLAVKRAVEEAVTYRYFLRSFGCKVSIPTVIYGDNRATFISSTEPGTALEKKHVALSYHFCREHFLAKVVDIRLIDGKCNFADAMTKALSKTQFDGHITQLMDNGPGQGENNELPCQTK